MGTHFLAPLNLESYSTRNLSSPIKSLERRSSSKHLKTTSSLTFSISRSTLKSSHWGSLPPS